MCLSSPKAPVINQTVAPPAAPTPQPLALAMPELEGMSVGGLRLGGRNSLRTRADSTSPGTRSAGEARSSIGNLVAQEAKTSSPISLAAAAKQQLAKAPSRSA